MDKNSCPAADYFRADYRIVWPAPDAIFTRKSVDLTRHSLLQNVVRICVISGSDGHTGLLAVSIRQSGITGRLSALAVSCSASASLLPFGIITAAELHFLSTLKTFPDTCSLAAWCQERMLAKLSEFIF